MRYMADACIAADLPGWELQASYVDGLCRSNASTAVRISSIATNDGNVGDVEPGNPGWPTWVTWVQQRRAAGIDPSLYCCADGYGGTFWDGWRHQDGVAAFAAAGVPEPHWWVFRAGTDIPDYAMAVQNGWDVPPGYDVSTVRDYWPGVDPPIQHKEKDVFIFSGPDGIGYLVCSIGIVPLPDLDTANQLTGQGVPWLKLDQAGHDAILAAGAAHGAGLQGKVSGALSVSGTLTAS